MKDSQSVQIRVLEHPLDRKSLALCTGPGVYIFTSSLCSFLEKNLTDPEQLLSVLRSQSDVFYVGKAKQLNERLRAYRAGGGSQGDWYKSQKLGESARSVLLLSTPTHFEACLLEVLLIRILDPQLNFMSTRAGKLYFLQHDPNSFELMAVQRRRPGLRTWGCMRLRSEVAAAFDSFQDALEYYQPESNQLRIRPADLSPSRRGRARRFSFRSTEKKFPAVEDVLRGKKIGLMEAVWNSMRQAAQSEQFHQAAQLRDVYLALRQLQMQLRRSRKILRRLRNNRFVIGGGQDSRQREYVLKKYSLANVAYAESKNTRSESCPFMRLMAAAIELFKSEFQGQNDAERLRHNFEFLRLMLWWLDHQPEDCTLQSSASAKLEPPLSEV